MCSGCQRQKWWQECNNHIDEPYLVDDGSNCLTFENLYFFVFCYRWWPFLRSTNASIVQIRSPKERSIRLSAIWIRCIGWIVACCFGFGNIDLYEFSLSTWCFVSIRSIAGQSNNVNSLYRRSSIPAEQFLERSMEISMACYISTGQW